MVFLNQYSFFLLSLCVFVQALEGTDNVTALNATKKFYVGVEPANFFEAFVNCKVGGMQLASIENEVESAALEKFLDPYKIDGIGANGFWLSGTNLVNAASKQYYWLSTGVRAIFTNWYAGQPDDAGGLEHCLQWFYVNTTGVNSGWNDYVCNTTTRYVCEYLSN